MQYKEYIVNLDLSPHERWLFLIDFSDEMNALIGCYLRDFEGAHFLQDSLDQFKRDIISSEYIAEIEFISSISIYSADQILLANLYYDILKFYFGCTAFAVENNGIIFHSRNLDWHTENNLLSKSTKIFDFQRNGKTVFKTIGWPGFIGALSGMRPNAFSVSLNAVLSEESPSIACPVSFLLRDILSNAISFEEAKNLLEKTRIASDCLLLLSGIKPNEMVVIERTPHKFATRNSDRGFVVVTNDYKKLGNHSATGSLLQETSCGRYEQAVKLLEMRLPDSEDDCFEILKDEKVIMKITVQQMVLNNNLGSINLIVN